MEECKRRMLLYSNLQADNFVKILGTISAWN